MGMYNPRNTIVVTSRDGDFDNGCTLSWHSPVSFSPFLYGIFLGRKRKSFEMIKKSNQFCVNFLTFEMEDIAMNFGTVSGRNGDKFEKGHVEKEDCDEIDCCRIKGCSAYLECTVDSIHEIGDHYLVVGKVIKQVKGNNKKKLFQSNIDGPYAFSTTQD